MITIVITIAKIALIILLLLIIIPVILIASKSVIFCVGSLNVESLESDVDRFAGHDEGSGG